MSPTERERSPARWWWSAPRSATSATLARGRSRRSAGADVIYCEDTRRTRALLTHAGITGATLRSLHAHNEDDRIDEVLGAVADGRTVVLVSDAGMPGVSDPGAGVVAPRPRPGFGCRWSRAPRRCSPPSWSSGLAGPIASASRASCPGRAGSRRAALAALAARATDHRALRGARPGGRHPRGPGRGCASRTRPVAIARELTKMHEEIWRGTLAEAAGRARGRVRFGGRSSWSSAGSRASATQVEVDDARLLGRARAAEASRVPGTKTRGRRWTGSPPTFGVPRRRVYELALGSETVLRGTASLESAPAAGGQRNDGTRSCDVDMQDGRGRDDREGVREMFGRSSVGQDPGPRHRAGRGPRGAGPGVVRRRLLLGCGGVLPGGARCGRRHLRLRGRPRRPPDLRAGLLGPRPAMPRRCS